MNVLIIDTGRSYVKILATDQTEPRRCASGPTLAPKAMVARVKNKERPAGG